jgi:hypothetical protein
MKALEMVPAGLGHGGPYTRILNISFLHGAVALATLSMRVTASLLQDESVALFVALIYLYFRRQRLKYNAADPVS